MTIRPRVFLTLQRLIRFKRERESCLFFRVFSLILAGESSRERERFRGIADQKRRRSVAPLAE